VEQLSISFRDFVNYLVPGGVLLFALALAASDRVAWFEWDPVVVLGAFTFGSYTLGFLTTAVMGPVRRRLFRWIAGPDALAYFWNEGKPGGAAEPPRGTLAHRARRLLVRHLGPEALAGRSPAEVAFLCMRYVDVRSVPAAELLHRINALGNLYAGLFSSLLLVLALAVAEGWPAVGAACAVALALLPFEHRRNRRWFARSILRFYYVLRLEEEAAGGRRRRPG
jgi:hypothetical protein